MANNYVPGMFGGIRKETPLPTGSDPFLTEGEYLLEVVRCSGFASQQKAGTNFFKVEFIVREARFDGAPKAGERRPAVGGPAVWLVNMNHQPAAGNIKGFLCALLDAAPEDVDGTQAGELCAEPCPAAGLMVRGRVTTVTTKSGHPFSKHNFWPADGQEESAAMGG